MEPTLDAVMARLEKLEVKTVESISAELYKIEDEFDKQIEKLYSENYYSNSGLVMFNSDLKRQHEIIVHSLVSQELPVPEVPEPPMAPEPVVESTPEPEIIPEPVVEPVVETIEPVEIEVESPVTRSKTTKPKITKTEEP
jgi:hypothetical protein